ncbi:type II secretion system F family protein [Nitriliruptoraceae bacterium ZYF776]|nr:type II secretion system F family protein [Profundirhabdus halotolerans]
MSATTRSPLDQLRLRVAAGAAAGSADDLDERAQRVLRVARDTGAPLLAALDGAAAAEGDRHEAEQAVEVAAAQAKIVAWGLVGAPVVLVPALGRLLGLDLVGYYSSPIGIATAVLAVVLLATGALLVRRLIARVGAPPRPTSSGGVLPALVAGVLVGAVVHLVLAPVVTVAVTALRRRRPDPPAVGLDEAIDLVATAIGGGCGLPGALRAAADELPHLATPLRRLAFDLELGRVPDADELPAGFDRLLDVLTTATAVGAPVGPTLRRIAADVRSDELARVLAAAQRLPAQLIFPTALFLLPATLVAVGAPIVSAGLSTLELTF